MRTFSLFPRLSLSVATAALASLLIAVQALAPAALRAAECPPGASGPSEASWASDRAAMLCLINRERKAAHVATLRENRQLDHAANRYAKAMVTKRFFAHADPSGVTFDRRFAASGYLRGAITWLGGENLGWGAGNMGSPEAMLRAWLASAGHRANLLDPTYRDVGIGVAVGTPSGGYGATWAAEFGQRSIATATQRHIKRRR